MRVQNVLLQFLTVALLPSLAGATVLRGGPPPTERRFENVIYKPADLSSEMVALLYPSLAFLDIEIENPNFEEVGQCMGFLISDRHVLTAGHCVDRARRVVVSRFRDANQVRVVKSDARNWVMHSQWRGLKGDKERATLSQLDDVVDLAVVGLQDPFDGDHGKYVATPTVTYLQSQTPLDNLPLMLIAQLHDQNLFPVRTLRRANYTAIRRVFPHLDSVFRADLQPALPPQPTSTCGRDSGAPVIVASSVWRDGAPALEILLAGVHSRSMLSGSYAVTFPDLDQIKKATGRRNQQLGDPNCVGGNECRLTRCGKGSVFFPMTDAQIRWIKATMPQSLEAR